MFVKIKYSLFVFLFMYATPGVGFAESGGRTGPSEDQVKEIQMIYERGWYLLSQIHVDKSGLDDALNLYNQVLTIDPQDKDIHWKLSEMTFKKAEARGNDKESMAVYETALAHAKKARELFPDSIEAHFWVGCCSAKLAEIIGNIMALGYVNEAIKELQLTISINPNHRFTVMARAILAAIFTESPWPLRNMHKAEEYALTAVSGDPNLTIASIKLANVYKQQKQYDKARGEALRCLSIEEPTYLWDAVLYNWPAARTILKELEEIVGRS